MNSNVLFFVIDGFRADYCNDENKLSFTPNLDKLIKNGVSFNQAISSADATSVSLGSIFTGLNPYDSKIYTFKSKTNKQNFFNHLQKLGYNLYLTLPNSMVIKRFSSNINSPKSIFQSQFHHLDEGYGDEILKRLDKSNLKESWFHLIHLMDLHHPIIIPQEFDSKKFGTNDYEKSISVTDYWLGKFLEKIDLNSTLVIITADHGEYVSLSETRDLDYEPEFKNIIKISAKILPKNLKPFAKKIIQNIKTSIKNIRFNNATKNLTNLQKRNLRTRAGLYLYDDLIRVPLIFTGNCISIKKIIHHQIASIGIFPTILDLIELPQMNEKIEGESLISLIKNQSFIEKPIYIESAAVTPPPELTGNVIGIRTPKFKYFRSRKNPKENVHLYDLKNDPLEETNLIKINSEMADKMELILLNFLKKSKPSISKNIMDEEIREIQHELKKLGYV
jgi:arylsulfatase A-like enzyme